MNALLNHVWRESRAADRVWSHVTGLALGRAVSRLLMVMTYQAFIDESEGEMDYVMAGHVASAEAWAKFSQEWESLLPLATLTRNGCRRFKMSEMAASHERRKNIPAFYRVIEDNVLFSISCRFEKSELERAQSRAHDFMYSTFRHTTDFQEIWKNPWYVAF
jgi:hypothetical protein